MGCWAELLEWAIGMDWTTGMDLSNEMREHYSRHLITLAVGRCVTLFSKFFKQ